MTKEEIRELRALFPKTCMITEEMIGLPYIGTKLLKTFIPEKFWEDMFWGLSIGSLGGGVDIKTTEDIVYKGKKERIALYLDNHITEPRDITFTLR